jgi:hypothetical protein
MANDAPVHFGKWLRWTIEGTALTFSEFCRRALIPRPTIQRWIDSACPPIRGCNVVRLAKALGIERDVIEAKLAEARAGTGGESAEPESSGAMAAA